MKFENKSQSYIASNDLIFITHFDFAIYNLLNNEILFEDKNPFGSKVIEIEHIVYVENKELIVLISFNGDFVIYHFNQKRNCLTKLHTYIEKGTLCYGDIYPPIICNEFLLVFLLNNGKAIIRKISFNGEIFDYTFDNCIHGSYGGFLFNNDLTVRINGEIKILDTSSDSIKLVNVSSLFSEIKEKQIKNVFSDTTSQSLYCSILDNKETIVFKRDQKLEKIASFKKHYSSSILCAKFVDKHLDFVEQYKSLHNCSFKLYMKFGDRKKNIDCTEYHKKYNLLLLSSFNERWVSFVSYNGIYVFEITNM